MEDHRVMCDCTFCRQREAGWAEPQPVPGVYERRYLKSDDDVGSNAVYGVADEHMGLDPAVALGSETSAMMFYPTSRASLWPARGVFVPETWEGEASSPADELKPEGVQMPAGLLAEIICWLRVAADRTNLRHLGARALTPHERYAPVKISELAKVLSKVDAALRQLGVTNVDMIVERDTTKPVVSATDTREPLFVHKRTGGQYRLINDDCPGKLSDGNGWEFGVLYRGEEDGVVRWTNSNRWSDSFKRVV